MAANPAFPRSAQPAPIFFDPSRRRWITFLATLCVTGALVLGPVAVLVAGIYNGPDVDTLVIDAPSPDKRLEPLTASGPGRSQVADIDAFTRPISFAPAPLPDDGTLETMETHSPSFVVLAAVGSGITASSFQLVPPVEGGIDGSPSISILETAQPSQSTSIPFDPPRILSEHTLNRKPIHAASLGGQSSSPVLQFIGALFSFFVSPVGAAEFDVPDRPEVVAISMGDEGAPLSVAENLDKIDVFVPSWLSVAEGGTIAIQVSQRMARTLDLLERAGETMRILPMLTCGRQNGCSEELVRETLASPVKRAKLIDGVLAFISAGGFAGVTIDLATAVDRESAGAYRAFSSELFNALRERGLLAYHRMPMRGSAVDPSSIVSKLDAVIVRSGRGGSGPPGPIISQLEFGEGVERWARAVPAEKLVFEVVNLAHDRAAGVLEARVISTVRAYDLASEAGSGMLLDPEVLNWRFTYKDESAIAHQVWMLDAVTAFNHLRSALSKNPRGIALGRLGMEDATIWDLLDNPEEMSARALERIAAPLGIEHSGVGEVTRLTEFARDGARSIALSPEGLVVSATVERFPRGFEIEHWGDTQEKVIALTFDDGPHPVNTPAILDVLAEYDVPATFFSVGHNMLRYPDLVRQMLSAGHEVGNHTFSHVNITNVGPEMLRFELNASQRIFESITGRNFLLFRPPYAADTNPTTTSEYFPLKTVAGLGYLTVHMNIDPKDWRSPNAERIASSVIDGATSGIGKVVLLHDGGGDRSETVEALPSIIEALRAKGYRFVTISELIGQSSEAVMPPSQSAHGTRFALQKAGFSLVREMERVLVAGFMIAIGLGIARSLILIAMSFLRRRPSPPSELSSGDKVAVIVPAHNEEKVILKTVHSLLQSDYQNVEVLVVDDGSTDNTFELCRDTFRDHANVRVTTKANGGKAAALNYGFAHADTDIVIAIDADTILLPDAITRLVAAFSDNDVAAVSGNAKVGNRVNLLTKWQALEYITAQNLDRRAFDVANCITVVPGAIGAWRRKAVLDAGGFTTDTLAEDADLTLRLIRRGYRVVYEDRAIAFTEAPETSRQFVTQRFRWMFGMLQVAFKHLDSLKLKDSRAVGLIAIPNVMVFQIVFPLVAPIADLVALGALLEFFWRSITDSQFLGSAEAMRFILLFSAFVLLDAAAAAIAFWHEKNEDWLLLLWLVPQRFYYRQLIYIVAIRAALTAIRGSFVGWGFLARSDSVKVPADRTAVRDRA